MYSVVLMMALTGSTEAVDFGKHRCGACNGCDVACSTSCGYNGCGYVAACNGCGHNGCDCGRRGLFHRRRGCCCPPACDTCSAVVVPTCGTCGAVVPSGPAPVPAPPAKEMPKTTPAPAPQKTQIQAPATIIVQVPENATLTIDGNATRQTSARRVFTTPALANGTYTIQVVDGNAVQTREVSVVGGRTTEVSFVNSSVVASR